MTARTSPFPPDFLILGAQKCGTTSMADALRSHPDIFVPRFKEAHHFGRVPDEEVGGAAYCEFFSEWAGQSMVGEATPEYLSMPSSADQICRFLPEVLGIVQLRNPIDRAYSAFWHGVRAGRLRSDFSTTVDEELAELAAGNGQAGRVAQGFRNIVVRGQYAEQLQRYFDGGFDRERMLILVLEEILDDPTDALRTVQEFLGVAPLVSEFPHLNETGRSILPRRMRSFLFANWRTRPAHAIESVTVRPFSPPPMDPQVRSRLVEHYRPWNERLGVLLGRDFSDWDR